MKKKLFVFIFAIAFILTAGICLTACGGGGDDRTLTNVTLSFAGDEEESTVVNKNIYEDQGWNSLNFRINLYYSDGSNYYDYYQRDELARYVDSVEYRASSTATAVGKDYATFNQLAEEYNLDVGIWKITLVYNDYVLIANINVLSKQDNNAYTLEINSLVNNSFSRKNTISYGTRYAGIEWKVYKNQVPTAIDSSLVSLRILTDDNGYKEIGDASTTAFGTPKQAAEQSKLSDLASNIGYLNAGNYLVCAEIRNEDYNVETTYSAFTKLTVLKSKIEFIGTPTFTYTFNLNNEKFANLSFNEMFPVGHSLDDGNFASNESIVVLKSDGNNENNDVQDIDGKLTTEQIVDDNYISHYGDFVATLNYTYNYEKDRDYYTVAMKFVPNEAYADNYEASDTFSGNLVVNQGVAWDPYINVSNYLKVYFDANGNKEAINGISTTVSGEYAEIAGNLAATGIDSRFEDNVYLFRKSNNNIQLVNYSSTVYLMASNAGTHKVWCYLNPNFAYSGDTNYIEENSDNVSIDENNTILYQWEMAKYELELGSWCFKNDADGTYNLELNSDGKVFVSFYGTTDEHVFLNGLDFNFEVLSESETDTYLTATGSIAIRTDGNEEGNKRRQVITIDSYEPVFAPRDSITVVVRVSFAGNADIAAFDEECQLYNIKVADVPDAIKNFESEDNGFLIEQRISGYNPIIYTLKPTETFETFMEALDAYKTANNLAGTFKVYCYKQGQNSYEEMTLNDYGTQTRDDLVNGDIYNDFKIEYIGKNTASDEFTFEFKSGKDITGKMFEFRDVVLMHADGTAPTDADSTFISMTQGIKADNLTQSGDSTVGTTAICEYAETLNSFGKVSGTFTINGATFDQLIQDEGPYHYYYDVRGEETTVSIFTYDEYNNQDVENRLVGNFVGDTLTLTMKVPGSNNELIWEFTFKLTGSLPDVND